MDTFRGDGRIAGLSPNLLMTILVVLVIIILLIMLFNMSSNGNSSDSGTPTPTREWECSTRSITRCATIPSLPRPPPRAPFDKRWICFNFPH
ncbi:PxORF13 peptide [Plutella xylostella granulovirus]|uniref:PxORF13 peptide n=1 Tax=Plutella xylostella granulovirus TaxID=98383 RepID=Q9DW17_9BBAC|nr:PxORF13 peptide [Plutella xylostella granulovirus]AAG27311.1 PxORF13 peptide [Plutella xylostella granulovirus]